MTNRIHTINIIKRSLLALVAAVVFCTSVSVPSKAEYAGSDAVSRAESWVGIAKYVWGACSPGEFDDSGFVSYCITGRYARVGTTYTFLTWPQTSNPQPGDICVCSGHCGIYVGNGEMIHAATEGLGVRKDPVHKTMIFVKSIY